MATLASAIVCTSLLVAFGSASAQGLIPDCPIPFASIAKHQSIDDNCGARGEVPDPPVDQNDPAHALQNVAKNNFCATGTRLAFAAQMLRAFISSKATRRLRLSRDG